MIEGEDVNGHTTSPLLNVLSMSNVLAPDQQWGDLMPSGNYYRLEPQISYAESGMDAPDVNALFDTAKKYITTGDGAPKFEAVVKALKAGQPVSASS